jgi:peptidoglycan hydrolase-like protein with peptidoglycan-binding domain
VASSRTIWHRTARWWAAAALTACAAPAAAPAAPAPRAGVPAPPPLRLPAPGAAAQAWGAWIVGGKPGPATEAAAARFGARRLLDGAGIYSVPRARARALAAALRADGRLTFAEPDARGARTRAAAAPNPWRAFPASAGLPADPLTGRQWWLRAVVRGSLARPAVTSASPLLAVLDSQVDGRHPDIRGSNIRRDRPGPLDEEHGTAVTTAAAAPDNGAGIVGIWPGMRVSLHTQPLTTAGIVAAFNAIIREHAAVANLSYGGGDSFAERVAQSRAFGAGTLLVAAAGNEFEDRNPVEHPAGDPHVLTAAAVDRSLKSSYFSNENNGIDVSAPGEGVLLGVPRAFDTEDGRRDGYTELDGTSFAAPIIAAGAAWVRAARPTLTTTQLFDVVRYSARDLGPKGWEARYGYGLLDVRAALAEKAPAPDPGEPNDDVGWVDGTYFAADGPIWAPGAAPVAFAASLDQWEDPADVYRVVVPAGGQVTVTVKPSSGDADLQLYSASARTVYKNAGLLGSSARRGTAADTVTFRNSGAAPRTVLAVAYIDSAVEQLDASYDLSVRGG